jgi:transposase
MSAPGADPLAAIRQRHARYAATSDATGFVTQGHADMDAILTQWDTRESALRALVAQDRSLWTTHRDTANTYLERGDESSLRVAQFHNVVALIHQRHAEAVERLLSGPQP